MLKRGILFVIIVVSLILYATLSLTSAFQPPDFLNNLYSKITGKVTYEPSSLNNGLVAYYKLDDNAQDSSGNNKNGVISGGVTSTSGKFEQAYHFDGTGYIDIGNIDFSNQEFTISSWIKTTDPGQYNNYREWISKVGSRETGTFEFNIHAPNNANGVNFMGWTNGQGISGMENRNVNVRDGNWHYVVGTYKRGSQSLYVDGVLSSTNNYAGDLPITAQTVQIGGTDWHYYHHRWVGDIDEIRIYNRVLNATEVQELYNPIPTCTSFTYSDWSNCSATSETPSGTQTRTIETSSPTGCMGGVSILNQSCIYVSPVVVPEVIPPVVIPEVPSVIVPEVIPLVVVPEVIQPIECLLYSPILCENGVIVSRGSDSNGCALPPICVVGEDTSIIDKTNNVCDGCFYNNTCMPVGYRIIIEDKPAYCDISGVNFQKKNTENITQTCQNSFECESNLCSAGECVEIMGSKATLVRIICKLSNLNNESKYLSCIDQYIYGVESTLASTPTETIQPTQLCVSNWSCGVWSSCDQYNNKNRICYDINNCGIDEGKPALTENCTVKETSSQIVEVKSTEQNFAWWNPSTWTGVTNNP